MTIEEIKKNLEGKFTIESMRDNLSIAQWRICCKGCTRKWSLLKRPDYKMGLLLQLLNHYASHE